MILAAAGPWTAAGAAIAPEQDAPEATGPCLTLSTSEGEIAIRLLPAAAPNAVATIDRLARGPIYDLDVVPRPEAARSTGYFDGLELDYARPRLELRLSARRPAEAFTVEAELDAAALGLDAERVADAGEAMDLLQMELLPALKRPGTERVATPELEAWAQRFESGGYDPSFLVGTSRRTTLEAIGYRFRDGLASRPATRGAVAFVPVSPTEAKLSLAILLADHPQRTGRWVVIGEVAGGLDVAEQISLRPLAEPARRDYRPLYPVAVDRATLTDSCRTEAPEGGTP